MPKIKVLSKRTGGNMFHYAHFIGDCLIPEVVGGLYNYETVLRPRTLRDTIGVFSSIYEEVMGNKNVECSLDEFNSLNIDIFYPKLQQWLGVNDFAIFRKYVFKKLNIMHEDSHPKVLLIRRGERVELIKDKILVEQLDDRALTTGRERREIGQIEKLEALLSEKVKSFKVLYLENIPFREQINYFKNARYIIGAHGAGLSNMVFCEPGCKILEVTCGAVYGLFNQFSRDLSLDYIKIHNNSPRGVLDVFEQIYKED